LEKLEGRLQKLVESFPQGAFVRLSTRSPKDAVLLSPKLYENLEKFIDDETEDPNAYVSEIRNLSLFYCEIFGFGRQI
jgi:hypothetical protein